MNFIIKLVLMALSAMVGAYLLPGVNIEGFEYALILAAVLALLNAVLKPLLVILTIPITFLTLGLFLIVINTVIILIAESIIPAFTVDGFWWAMLFSFCVSILNSIFENIAGTKNTDNRTGR